MRRLHWGLVGGVLFIFRSKRRAGVVNRCEGSEVRGVSHVSVPAIGKLCLSFQPDSRLSIVTDFFASVLFFCLIWLRMDFESVIVLGS